MAGTLYLLDGMALVYRAHFALIRNPIFNSKGENTSALYGFTNTLLDILNNRGPTHVALAMDSPEPTGRHEVFEDYKAHREEIPEDIAAALPHIQRMSEALGVSVLAYPGYEADDIIGTFARLAEEEGLETYMVTPDKDFAQLVTSHSRILRPARKGNGLEELDVDAIREQWNVKEPGQVVDILGLWGDASDNIPGVPGYGEKTAKKLIGQYETIENLLDHVDDLKGKQRERLVEHKEQALMSKELATIDRHVPVKEKVPDLLVSEPDTQTLKSLFTEFEFNSLGKRVFGEDFIAGRGAGVELQGEFLTAELKTLKDTAHHYALVADAAGRDEVVAALRAQPRFCFDVETDGLDPRQSRLLGIAFSWKAGEAVFVALPETPDDRAAALRPFLPLFADPGIEKVGHHLKFDISVMQAAGVKVSGPLFDTMLAHFLVEPDQRHGLDELAERYLGYRPVPISDLIGEKGKEQRSMAEVPLPELAEYAGEDADLTWQLRDTLLPLLEEKAQTTVFSSMECPLVYVLADMECAGMALDGGALTELSAELERSIVDLERGIQEQADCEFNLNSPKQLGEVLFEKLQLVEKPKKTKTGQYATNEQVLSGLAPRHPIVADILDYRELTKLKSTYVDALPQAVSTVTGRIHTSFSQTATVTGRLASSDPNLQNIPVRTEQGRQIRKAFVARDESFRLLSADYSQVELRVMASMSGDAGLKEAFGQGLDIHAATAARIYGAALDDVDANMRRTAKMVNFGIIYGISAFGLSQRLGVPRTEASAIIEQYFHEYPRVREFIDETIEFCQCNGYVETMTGRRRMVRDINSANGTTRAAAERMAVNAPIQGTAADMIKRAMIDIHAALGAEGLKTHMVLQVHDELVFEMHADEEEQIKPLVERLMVEALPLSVPVVVDMGVGRNWLEAH